MIVILKLHSNGINANNRNGKRLKHGNESSGCPMTSQNHTCFTNSSKLCQTLNVFKTYLIALLLTSLKPESDDVTSLEVGRVETGCGLHTALCGEGHFTSWFTRSHFTSKYWPLICSCSCISVSSTLKIPRKQMHAWMDEWNGCSTVGEFMWRIPSETREFIIPTEGMTSITWNT